MLPEFLFFYILLIHFLGDFALQTHEQAIGKSTDVQQLFYHVMVYSAVWFIAVLPILGFAKAFAFFAITAMCHDVTDYFTSRIGKPFWDKKDLHNGFVIIGLDQILHYVQLYYTFKLLL